MNAMEDGAAEREAAGIASGGTPRRPPAWPKRPATVSEIEWHACMIANQAEGIPQAVCEIGDKAAFFASHLAWELTTTRVRRADCRRRAWAAAGWWMLGAACGVAAWAIAGGL